MTTIKIVESQRRLLRAKWAFVVNVAIPRRPWWKFWAHQHHHRMTFPSMGNGRELDWVFICACGHTTSNIDEATP